METVQLAIAEHQWPLIVVVGTILCFVAGWAVFAWTR